MDSRVTEIAAGIYRISTYVDAADLVFNQYLIDAEEPLLFHTGLRGLFPRGADAVARVLPFGHLEADECGAMNSWLGAAPESSVAHGALGCAVSVNDLADRMPRPLADGEALPHPVDGTDDAASATAVGGNQLDVAEGSSPWSAKSATRSRKRPDSEIVVSSSGRSSIRHDLRPTIPRYLPLVPIASTEC